MSRQDDLRRLIASHSRRLQKLREQEARFGINAPPELLIEIDDIENEIGNLEAEIRIISKTPDDVSLTIDNSQETTPTARKEAITALIRNHNLRLQKLKEQLALNGIATDPRVALEIEDIEDQLEELDTELQTLEAQPEPPLDNGQEKSYDITSFVKLKNPYTFGVPVRGEDNFFGREQELHLIFDTLESVPRGQKQDLVLMGPRRIGKSSILLRLLDICPADFAPIYIDLQAIKPREPYILFVTILRQINKIFRQQNLDSRLPVFEMLTSETIPEKLQYITFGDDISAIDQAIAREQLPRLILMFDEVELLTEIGGVSALEWFRSLIQSLNYCVFIVAGSDLLYELTTDYTSPFYNIFKIIEVRALSEEAATSLITVPASKVGLTYPPSEIRRILHFTGRNPYFIQAMGHYLVEWLNKHGRRKVQPDDIDHVADQMIDNLSAQFNYFWSSFKAREQGLLYLLAQKQTPQTGASLTDEFLDLTNIRLSKQEQREIFANLSRQQAIYSITEKGEAKYSFVVQLFASWIKAKINRDEIFDRIRRLELVDQVTESDKDYLKSLIRRRNIYRQNLNWLEMELVKYADNSFARTHLFNQIENTKSSISELEEQIRGIEAKAQ
jgi:AAA+ ATPase superfamily predicted ATPase